MAHPTPSLPNEAGACVEQRTPVHAGEDTGLGFTADDVLRLASSVPSAELRWADGSARTRLDVALTNLRVFAVSALPNPDYQPQRLVHCADHVQLEADVALASRDERLKLRVERMVMATHDGKRLVGHAGALEDAGGRVAEVPATECALSLSLRLALERKALSGELTRTVALAPCAEARADTGAEARAIASW